MGGKFRPHRLFLDMENGLPPAISLNSSSSAGTNTIGSPYSSEANFDNNMVIVLAALLCALVCALGLNSAVRCALRCGYRFGLGTPADVQAPAGAVAELPNSSAAAGGGGGGLKKSALNQIPVIPYGSAEHININNKVTETECPICLGEFAKGDKVRILPKCSHGFHAKCIDTWLFSNSSCPLCRQPLLDNTNTPTS